MGFVGTNGSGKTTTIRNLMGFIRPDKGTLSVLGMNSWKNSPNLMNWVSYVPGEIAFPSLATGNAFLKSQADFLGIKNNRRAKELCELLALDPSANLKRMSKGMKQKTAIVAALMADRDVLIMDEPTTGLDPLMRDTFMDLMQEEKKKGKTIFMSSHIFSEIEQLCDRAAIINNGRILEIVDINAMNRNNVKTFEIRFATQLDSKTFEAEWNRRSGSNYLCRPSEKNPMLEILEIPKDDTGYLLGELEKYNVSSIKEAHISLEQYFMKTYSQRTADDEQS
ncbi:MAG: ABC transporter ATP-binding protein [Eggerthellaceae bacterium]|nr:ABC transporter ATP-binding protein [Eggerthellaceae bacterium]